MLPLTEMGMDLRNLIWCRVKTHIEGFEERLKLQRTRGEEYGPSNPFTWTALKDMRSWRKMFQGHHVALRPIMLWTMKLTRMMMPERE
jgi:hypothetical protein